MKDHVRRKLLPPRLFEPPGTQCLPERAGCRIEVRSAGPRFAIGPSRRPFARAFLDPKANGSGASQDLGGRGRERKTPVTGNIRQNLALRDQLAINREPSAAVQFGADAEGLEAIVPEPLDPLGFGAKQDVDEVMRAETLSRAVNCRKGLLRRNRSVPARARRSAIVAIAAGRVISFSEIAEEDLPPARAGLAVTDQRLDLLPLDPALAIGCLTRLEQAEQAHHIGHAVGHPGVRR